MKYGLLISGIVEIAGGLIVFFAPDLVLNEGMVVLPLAKVYCILAIVTGIINIYAYRHFELTQPLGRIIFMAMFFFHGAVALMSAGMAEEVFRQQQAGTYTHLAVFILFVLLYLKDVKPNHGTI